MITIDLSGSQGNAFYLMGIAKQIAKQIKIDHTPIIEQMMLSDYENLLRVFEENLGDYVRLVRR